MVLNVLFGQRFDPGLFLAKFQKLETKLQVPVQQGFPQIWAFCTFSLTMTWSIFDASDFCFFLLLTNFLSQNVTHVFRDLCFVVFVVAGSGTLVEMLWGWGAKSEPRAQFLDVRFEKNGLELAMLKVMVDSYGRVWKRGMRFSQMGFEWDTGDINQDAPNMIFGCVWKGAVPRLSTIYGNLNGENQVLKHKKMGCPFFRANPCARVRGHSVF